MCKLNQANLWWDKQWQWDVFHLEPKHGFHWWHHNNYSKRFESFSVARDRAAHLGSSSFYLMKFAAVIELFCSQTFLCFSVFLFMAVFISWFFWRGWLSNINNIPCYPVAIFEVRIWQRLWERKGRMQIWMWNHLGNFPVPSLARYFIRTFPWQKCWTMTSLVFFLWLVHFLSPEGHCDEEGHGDEEAPCDENQGQCS